MMPPFFPFPLPGPRVCDSPAHAAPKFRPCQAATRPRRGETRPPHAHEKPQPRAKLPPSSPPMPSSPISTLPMKLPIVLSLLTLPTSAIFNIDYVTVGNTGNATDSVGFADAFRDGVTSAASADRIRTVDCFR